MSLTSFTRMADVKARLKPLRPTLPRKLNATLKYPPRTKNHAIVGSAFDYLLRFEIQRRAPHAIARRWIADYVPAMIWRKTNLGGTGIDPLRDPFTGVTAANYMPPEEVADCCRRILVNAKDEVAEFIESESPSPEMQVELAAHAIRLAKLDAVFRAGVLDSRFQDADPEDVQDLVDLLSIVPSEGLIHKTSIFLNPDFNDASIMVGGADTDLITGNLLVDFKTTKKDAMDGEYLDQLLGYFLLARKQRELDPGFSAIERLGLYFSRHGYLWAVDASIWTLHPDFAELEEWFFNRAKELFPQPKPVSSTTTSP